MNEEASTMNSSLINRLLSPKSSPIASARTSCDSNNNKHDEDDDVSGSSYYQKTVCLYSWWLVRADKDYEGKRLAVAGFTSRELQAMRVFTSAPIVKVYDPRSLETSDGIYIIIKGLINKSRTMENGFSSNVFSHFNLGFHRDWEAYAEKCFVKEFMAAADLEFAADAGIANSNSNATPMDHKSVKGKNKHNAGDINISSEYVSANTLGNVSKSSDLPNRAADHNDISNTSHHASTKFSPSMRCDRNNVSSLVDNLTVPGPTEPSGCHVRGSSERLANSTRKRKGNTGTATKSKTKDRSRLDSITTRNVASGESPIPKGSDADTANPSNTDSAVDTAEGSEMGSVSVLHVDTRNIEENDNMCGELQKPSHSTLVRDKLKEAQSRKKISQAGTPRQNKNNLAKSPLGPGDRNHNCNLKTAVDERERNAKVVSSRKKVWRKINFDADASPHTQERKKESSIVSPESLSLKRSRSGRLLVPSLDFWRNQIAVYDAGRKITGIQEGLDILRSPKGILYPRNEIRATKKEKATELSLK